MAFINPNATCYAFRGGEEREMACACQGWLVGVDPRLLKNLGGVTNIG